MSEADAKNPVPLSSAETLRRVARLHGNGRFAEAEALLQVAIGYDPQNPELHNARGVMFAAMGRYLDAVWCYREAIRGQGNAVVWTNLGNALTHLKYLKSAITCHRRAIALDPKKALLHYNLGVSLTEAGQHGEAVLAFSRALELDPGYHMARWDRGRSYLYLGNYHQGWDDYEARLVTGQVPARQLPGEKWDGTPYGGQRLLLLAEQGFGDTLWVARYLPRVRALGGELIIECQRELIPLIEGMGLDATLVMRGEPLPEADLHCYLCSLPGLFTRDFASIPSPPYLTAPADRIAKFRSILAGAEGQLKIGFVWSGSVTFKRNEGRAQPPLRFFQAFAMPGVQLYSLQKGPLEKHLLSLPSGSPAIDLAPYIADFADTAAAVAQLDLVIMTDSAVAHLAGAMGKPVWVLLGHLAHWLWLSNRTDNPWYPSMRLFRPRAEGDWDYVFDAASVELMNLAIP